MDDVRSSDDEICALPAPCEGVGLVDVACSERTSTSRSDALRQNSSAGAGSSPANDPDSDALIFHAPVFYPVVVLVLAITVLVLFA